PCLIHRPSGDTLVARRTLLAVAIAAALALSACASPDDADDQTPDAAPEDSGEISIEHAFGTTQIPAGTSDVVTLGRGSTEAALALGVVPVGIEAQTYAVDDNGLLPWVNEELEQIGAEPTILPATVEEPAYEDIDALQPDLILAPYSGLSVQQYDLLSE